MTSAELKEARDFIKRNWVEIAAGVIISLTILLIIVAVIASVSNENNKIDEGIIIDKRYTDGYYNTVISGNVPVNTYISKKYIFVISGEKDGEIVEYEFEVSSEEYDKYKIGDFYKR